MRRELTYTVRDVAPYINWIYYFHAWGIEPRFATATDIHDCPSCRAAWIVSFPTEEQSKAHEAIKLYEEAVAQLREWADEAICHAIFLLAEAYSEDDDIIVDHRMRIPFLRQQHADLSGHTLCLSDFIAPYKFTSNRDSTSITNNIGVFATTVSSPPDVQFSTLDFQFSTLADRLAEATAEKMHEEVRKHYWGYAKEESLTMRELHAERFQGIRPAVGYPCLPDQSINFLIDDLLRMEDIGITLTENGAMYPHCSVSGFMFAHPLSKYFSISSISEEQLYDYAKRRAIDSHQARKFLAAVALPY